MSANKQTGKVIGISKPEEYPDIMAPLFPEDPVIPEDDPDVVIEEDPFENPPSFEIHEPGEGP